MRPGSDGRTRVVLVCGTTGTARIDGISAAGATPEEMVHTPAADAEILEYGRPIRAPVVPVSPSGCPTPAVVTRAVRELLGFETAAVAAGLARPTAAPTVDLGAPPGGDIRTDRPVPGAADLFESARAYGRALPDGELVVAETVPGGTTTAMGVLAALGERTGVSSSLAENPVALKREVVTEALEAAGLAEGDAAGDPWTAVEAAGDPVLPAVAGLAAGALDAGTDLVLAGGTQMAAAAALLRHAGVGADLRLATTSFLAADGSADVRGLAADLDLELTVTDPGFGAADHPGLAAYARGEAKEGVGMGGALALADRAGRPMAAVRERVRTVTDRLLREGVGNRDAGNAGDDAG